MAVFWRNWLAEMVSATADNALVMSTTTDLIAAQTVSTAAKMLTMSHKSSLQSGMWLAVQYGKKWYPGKY